MSELRLLKEKRQHHSDSLLMAKMQPPATGKLYSRPRLFARLDVASTLTLVTAPAGCGKTTLLCDWTATHPKSTSWVTLDETDNNLRQFLAYMTAVLDIGIEAHSPEEMLIAVLNGTPADGKPHTLILDNYHVIANGEVHRAVAFLLEHCPPNLRLIIAGRNVPPLPLARLRVHGKLNHIRSTELALSQQEAAGFLSERRLSGNAAMVAAMEGWAAGLQFIALASAESSAPDEQALLIRNYVREFVAQEILPAYPPNVQEFLLHTSILDTLTPERCNTLTKRQDGYAILESLITEGNFIRRLGKDCYRYAPFFQTALREHLALTSPSVMTELLERAEAIHSERGQSANMPGDLALSQREHEVLTMLADGLSSPEIARRMIIAVSTVKTHIKHIYRKLEVDNRYQAVKRAQELNIIQMQMEDRMRKMFR